MPLQLKVITPKNTVIDQPADKVTAPGADGEVTILPKHAHLLTLLKEGIITYHSGAKSDSLAIGGGYLETEGREVVILVSRAYKQDEIDEELTRKAIEEAKKILAQSKDQKELVEAGALLRRSVVDMKLVRRRKHP